MSYLVLARKYRPRNFSEMVGQEHVVQALTNALTQQRLHHAYLFTGTRGVGKTTVSRILAKSLNCQGVDGQGTITATPCGQCAACVAIDSGRFPDYTELDAASNRGVEEVQGLLEQAVYKPVHGRFKVFMIDEVHMLTNTAFNAMLKTLEEPPEYLKFVLATTDPQKVPVTVLSRCLQFNLRPMAPQTVLEHLTQVLNAEGVTAELPALHLLARAARGSMRDALSLTDQAIAFGSGQLQESGVRQMLGSVDRTYVFTLIQALAQGDGRTVVQTSDTLRMYGLSAAATLEEMVSVLQRMAILQVMPEGGGADPDPQIQQIAQLAASMPADETQLLYSICLHARAELGLAPDEYAALTMALLRLLAFKPPSTTSTTTTTTVTTTTAAAEKKTPIIAPSSPPQPQPQPSPPIPKKPLPVAAPIAPPPVAVVPVVPSLQEPQPQPPAIAFTESTESKEPQEPKDSNEGDFWYRTVQHLIESAAIGALVRELALQSQLVYRTQAHWGIRVEAESLNQPVARERLRAALQAAGHEVSQLSVEVGGAGTVQDSPARRNAYASAQRQRVAEHIVQNDSLVQTLMRECGAKIVPGSIRPV